MLTHTKSRFSYYQTFNNDEYSVCTNFLNGKITIFRGKAHEETKNYFSTLDPRKTTRGFELLREAGYFNMEENEDEELNKRREAAIEQHGRLSIVIFVTDKCNFRCKYCCQERTTYVLSEQNQNKLIEFLDKVLHRFNYLFIEWFGGEPLLYPDIIERLSQNIIKLCKKYNTIYNSHITTNGYFLDAAMLNQLRKNKVTSYQVTLDGLECAHDSQRVLVDGSGTWSRIVHNLYDIRDNIKTPTIGVMLRTNITREIHRVREEYLNFLKYNFSDDNRFHFLWKLAEDWGNIESKDKAMLCGTREYYDVVSLANKLQLRTRFLKSTLTLGGRMCEAGKKNHMILYADGTIGKCARRLNPNISNIATIDDLLNRGNELLNKTLKSVNNPNIGCKGCEKEPLCLSQACPIEPVTGCGYEMENIDFIIESISMTDDSCIIKYK